MKTKFQAHTVYRTQFHVVWIPKYRRKILVSGVKQYLDKVLQSLITEKYPDVYINEQKIMPDHIHLLLEIPPKYSVSMVVGYIKSASSRIMRQKFEYLRRQKSMWSTGFFVSSVGANEKLIKRYIRFQEKQDLGQSSLPGL